MKCFELLPGSVPFAPYFQQIPRLFTQLRALSSALTRPITTDSEGLASACIPDRSFCMEVILSPEIASLFPLLREEIFERIPSLRESIKLSTKRITMVLGELSNIANMEKISYFKNSRAIDVEKSLKERLEDSLIEIES